MKQLFGLSIMAGMLSACGGGQSGAVPNKANVLNPTVKQTATATLRIEIPASKASSSARKAQYISSATQSIAVTPAGGARQVFALTPASANCTAVNNGGSNLACTLQISAPVAQNEAFIISTYASTDASGTALSTVTSIANIVLGQNTNINATLNGVVASLSVAINPNSVPAGTATSVPVIVTGLDAAGKTIIGPGTYADANGNPVTITLSDADPSHSTTLAPMALTAPGQAATLSYNGHATQNLYVANSGGGAAINVYPQPETVTISASASGSSAVTAQLTITPMQGASGNVAPSRTITGSNVGLNGNGFVGNITVDGAGNLYVAVGNTPPYNGYVQVYASGANGNVAPVRTLVMNDPNGEFDPTGLAVDNARGELYVEDTTQEAINVYTSGTSGSSTPLRTIAGSNTGINNASIQSPPGIAFDPVSGDLYVLLSSGASSNKTLVFSQGANGNATPARTINFYLNNAVGGGVGPLTRDYYEVNNGDASVNVFAPTASGNDQPVSRIQGSHTALASPGYLALDDSENIYVQNSQNDSITVYASGANGNVMPVRTIAGSNTGNFNTRGIAIGP